MLLALATVLFLQSAPAPAQQMTDAYLDPAARTLVAQARERRSRVERRIDAYQVTGKERFHAGLRTLGRNRTLMRQELAARIHWQRDGAGRIEVLGARQAAPAVQGGTKILEGFRREAASLAFDPDELQLSLLLGMGPDSGDKDDLVDPLRPGSEAHYRFRSGDSTSIRLPDGRTIRLRELRVLPRRNDWRLVRGSMWIDSESHGVVRSVFRLARPFDLVRDYADVDDDGEELPAVVKTLGHISADVDYITVEYALWQGRWWLPRLISVDATAQVGVLGKIPVRFERSYSGYQVTARPDAQVEVLALAAVRDSTRSACPKQAEKGLTCACSGGRCRLWKVEAPADTTTLLTSTALPAPLSEGAETLITGEEVAELARVLNPSLGEMGTLPVTVRWRAADLGLLRYNRVEGLSVGARVDVGAGPLALDATARLGTADLEPGVEIGVARETSAWRYRLAGYRRLDTFDRASSALGLGASLSALLLGRDEADYLRATGSELAARPVRFGRWEQSWRIFAEHQHPVSRETDITLPRAWRDGPVFREVLPADRADQVGAALTLRTVRGESALGSRWTAGTELEAQAGSFRFGRASALGGLGAPIPFGLVGSLEGAVGTSAGTVPVQGLWYLGGPGSVRGYPGAAAAGKSFWRARGEVATRGPGARLATFMDAGWAGGRSDWSSADPSLLAAGVGASFLDGLIRADLARALRGQTGWRLDVYLDAAL
jgi:hypothetical protein